MNSVANPITMQDASRAELQQQRQAFYGEIDQINCTPLWEVLKALVPKTPTSRTQVAHWQWTQTRPALDRAAALITAQEAERRVLVLENPGLRGLSRINESLYAGLQLILPGEVAPPHRHSQGAIRFILQGSGAWTSVDDERVAMDVGDFVVTPSWTFHGHGNTSGQAVVWFDGLDLPIVDVLEAQFMEKPPADGQRLPAERQTRAAEAFINAGSDGIAEFRTQSLVFSFAVADGFLRDMAASQPAHSCWGYKLQYLNDAGQAPVPTIGAFLQRMPAGFQGRDYRSTDSTTYVIHKGNGRMVIDGESIAFTDRDVLVCPAWKPYRFEIDEETTAFSCSSRPVQQFLGLWRESY